MRSILRFSRLNRNFQHARLLSTSPEQAVSEHRLQIGGDHYQEGDRVIATVRNGKHVKDQLLPPLRENASTLVGRNSYKIEHNSIIGKPASRLVVECESVSSKFSNTRFRISQPSLDQFISLSPREVTPIYSSYGATLVSLLDIHVAPPSSTNHSRESEIPQLEILEAGTGNGGLTLHLARAIAAGNPLAPHFEEEIDETEYQSAWETWRKTRRAVVHTVEFNSKRSRAVANLIKSFRGALYWPHIDFHSGDVGAWVKSELERRQGSDHKQDPFLDIVILDLPAVDQQIQHVYEALKWGGRLVVWVPQVTQIAACQYQIAQLDTRLKLDHAIELGEGISTGRKWDVKVNVVTKADQNKERAGLENLGSDDVPSSENSETLDTSESTNASSAETDSDASTSSPDVVGAGADFPKMVCRPKVGEYIMGGGFVGIWTKVPKE